MKKSKKPMTDSTRVLRSSAAKKRPPESRPSAVTGGEIAAKRTRSEKSKDDDGGGGGFPIPRVLPSTKKVIVVRESKAEEEDRKPKKRGRPPKSSKEAPILVSKEKKKKQKKQQKKKSEGRSGGGEGRAAVKQRISDQIKALLLDAGWTIDLRPRNGRDYLDAVYIPPKPFKGSFWSVTKAYAVYQEHKKSSEEKSVTASDPIPGDMLSMLNRKTTPGARQRWKIGAGRTPNKRKGCALLARKSGDDYVPYPWKRTVLSWLIDSGVLSVDTKVNYVDKKGKGVMEGWITRGGIRCGCCSDVITPSEFEAHSGSKLRCPYQNIVVEEGGVSLLQSQMDAWEKQSGPERKGFWEVEFGDDDLHDDTCSICADGGDLVCCDGCPSTFHLECLDIETIPPGDWHCKNCACKFCGLISDASLDEDGATISPLLSCSQCEQKFHQGCIPNRNTVSLGPGSVFCGESCKMVFKKLQKLLGVKNDMEGGFSWTLVRRFDDASLPHNAECNSKIAVAFAIMDECFMPTIDQRSGIKVIHNVVYNCGANISRLDYSGFYTFILERGDEIMSAASVRIHGTRLAEMPYIGTRNMYRRQGLCRRLLSGIESALFSLNVEKLIIPAISELTETWTKVFGFKPLELSDKQEVRSINLLTFPGIDLLQKPILKVDPAEQHTVAERAEQGEREIDRVCELGTANECSVLTSFGSSSDEVACPS
ncbi:uncharacterized protein M6B38_264715 [Iris pallida]|uniref:PHD-type domain-containing protein n=1 Tax=Iris pallida TaxID=29817 RepID=A0AAX6IC52_IRIPA|nr:uncharacterized protein M6B38_264715 [Iris pallida]